MKYLKTFENFDLGPRFTDDSVETDEQDWLTRAKQIEDDGEFDEFDEFEDSEEDEDCEECEHEEELESRPRVWGDEVVEKKKVNPGFQAYLDKQKAKKGGKDEEKVAKGKGKDDKKDDKGKKEEPKKGLSAAQKKLPEAMQKAILKKQGK